MVFEKELNAAVAAVTGACRLALRAREIMTDQDRLEKDDRSEVTIADYACQAAITLRLAEAFPDIGVISEEKAHKLRENDVIRQKVLGLLQEQIQTATDSGMLDAIDRGVFREALPERYWTIDPIDGTNGFVHGRYYAIALALIENGAVRLGVLGCPTFPFNAPPTKNTNGCIFFASKNCGAFVKQTEHTDQHKINASDLKDSTKAKICQSVDTTHFSSGTNERISDILGITAAPVGIDSQCKYASVARGDTEIYLRSPKGDDYRERVWDHAAGAIIIEEAGGRVTDFYGRPLDFSMGVKLFNNLGVVATNGHLHEDVLAAITQAARKNPDRTGK